VSRYSREIQLGLQDFSPGLAADRLQLLLSLAWHCHNLTLDCSRFCSGPHRTAEQVLGHTQRSTSLLFRSLIPQVARPPSSAPARSSIGAGLSQGKKVWSCSSGLLNNWWSVCILACKVPLSLCVSLRREPVATSPSGSVGGVTSHSSPCPTTGAAGWGWFLPGNCLTRPSQA
jgi:hypothetical protein